MELAKRAAIALAEKVKLPVTGLKCSIRWRRRRRRRGTSMRRWRRSARRSEGAGGVRAEMRQAAEVVRGGEGVAAGGGRQVDGRTLGARRHDFQVVDAACSPASELASRRITSPSRRATLAVSVAGGGVAAGLVVGEDVVGGPLVDELVVDEELELRDAVVFVEVGDGDVVPAGFAGELVA